MKQIIGLKEFNWQSLFPKHKLTKAEREWLINYESKTGFQPINCEEVTGRDSFVDMMDENVRWFESWAEDMHTIINKSRHDVPYYINNKLRRS